MKKLVFLVLVLCGMVFANLPVAVVPTFSAMSGITANDAQVITELFIAELAASKRVIVVDRRRADAIMRELKFQASDFSDRRKTAELGRVSNANVIIHGQLMRMGDKIFWTATMVDVNSAEILASVRQELDNIGQASARLNNFVSQMVSRLPAPCLRGHFVGVWRSIGHHSAISELRFNANGTINVLRYDVVEDREVIVVPERRDHRGRLISHAQRRTDRIVHTSQGSGNFWVEGNTIRINLTLSNSNPAFNSVRTQNVSSTFSWDTGRNGFRLTNCVGGNQYCVFSKMQ